MSNALVSASRNMSVSPVGMVITGDIDYDEWASGGPLLGLYGRAVAFATGDWLVYGEDKFPDRYSQAIDTTGLSLGRLRNLCSMARRVPIENRIEGLSVSHHEAVAVLPKEVQRNILDLAKRYEIDRDQLRDMVKEMRKGTSVEELEETANVIQKNVTPDDIVEQARHVVLAWRNEQAQVSMTLHEALEQLSEMIE